MEVSMLMETTWEEHLQDLKLYILCSFLIMQAEGKPSGNIYCATIADDRIYTPFPNTTQMPLILGQMSVATKPREEKLRKHEKKCSLQNASFCRKGLYLKTRFPNS